MENQRLFDKTIQCIRQELQMKFKNPQDRGLRERRLRLRVLFGNIPINFASKFRNQLGEESTDDEFSKLFHRRLHSVTRAELLMILDNKISEEPVEESPKVFDSIWPNRPLPASMEARFKQALDVLKAKVINNNQHPNQDRLLCWINRLQQPNCDDRTVRWSTICHRETGAALPMSPNCPPTMRIVTESDMFKRIKAKEDIVAANEKLGFITYMKSHVLFAHDMTSMVLENFELLHVDIMRNLQVLEFMTTKPMGGGSATPPYYVAIKAWLRDQQHNSNSIYSCF